MEGSRRRQIEVAENLPHWREALRGKSYSLSQRRRKDPAANPSPAAMLSNPFPCNICGRRCTATIGLTTHMRSHRTSVRPKLIRRSDGRLHHYRRLHHQSEKRLHYFVKLKIRVFIKKILMLEKQNPTNFYLFTITLARFYRNK